MVEIETVAMVQPPMMEELLEEEIKQEQEIEPEVQPVELNKPKPMDFKQIPIQLNVNINPSDNSLQIPKFRPDNQDFETEAFDSSQRPQPKQLKKLLKRPKPRPAPKMVKKIAKAKALPTPQSNFSLGELDELPKTLNKPSLSFPRSLRARGIKQVRIKVLVQINTKGKAKFIKFADPLQYKILEKPIKRFIKRTLFTAPIKNGKRVNAQFIWPITISKG